MSTAVLAVFSFVFCSNTDASWLVKQVRSGEEVQVLSIAESTNVISEDYVVLKSTPFILSEHSKPKAQIYQEILFKDSASMPVFYHNTRGMTFLDALERPDNAELKTLVLQGPVKNRINLTIVGDGYTDAEKDKFFEDAQRITDDLFKEQTFSSYLPLFNVFAVFVPSHESGITDREKKDTALGLYRDPAGSKRAIMPGNTSAIEAAIAVAPATDFPILVANDDFYGGLGGRYAITSRSVESGSMVLRHELGHNFGDVGEEYDGGYVYRGANSTRSANVSWAHWVDGALEVFDAKFLSGSYVWQNLAGKPLKAKFKVPAPSESGPYELAVSLSSVGWQTPEDVVVSLDGQRLFYEGLFTSDRSFFEVRQTIIPTPGAHTLEVQENIHDGDNVLAFAQVVALQRGYDTTAHKIAAFPSFNDSGSFAGYRPTHNSCLMRNMRVKYFCAVDKENMWVRFLNRIQLIDEVKTSSQNENLQVQLKTPPLSGMGIRWFKVVNGKEIEIEGLRNQKTWEAKAADKGSYVVRVSFRTPEVRKYTSRFDAVTKFQL